MADRGSASHQRAVGIGLTAASAALFGLLPFFARYARMGGFSAETVLVMRFGFAALAVAALRLIRGETLSVPPSALKPLAIAGLAGYAGTALLLFLSYEFMPTGPATTIHFLYPATVALGAMLTGRERPGKASFAAIGLGILGLALAVEPWKASLSPVGVGLALASAFTYAIYVLCVSDARLAGLPRFLLTFWVSLLACAGLATGALASGRFVLGSGAAAWLSLAGMAVFSTVLAIAAFAEGIRRIGATTASILSTLEPLTAIAVGCAVMGERPGLPFAAGAALILASALIAAMGGKRGQPSAKA